MRPPRSRPARAATRLPARRRPARQCSARRPPSPPKLAQTLHVCRILHRSRGMREGKLPDLAVDAAPVDRDGARGAPKGGDHGRDRCLVELDARDLRQDRLLPGLVPVARLLTPCLARPRVELAVSAVGERAVALEPPAAGAHEEAPAGIPSTGTGRGHWPPMGSTPTFSSARSGRRKPSGWSSSGSQGRHCSTAGCPGRPRPPARAGAARRRRAPRALVRGTASRCKASIPFA
jgi:hypothetical protein